MLTRCLLTLVLIIITTVAATSLYIYHHHDQIITQALQTIMASTPYSSDIKKAHISLRKDFPQLSLILQDVTIHNPADARHSLAFAQITCSFNIIAWLQGQYSIDHVTLAEGICHLPIATNTATSQHTASVQLPITCPKVSLQNITIRYAKGANSGETVLQHAQADIASTDQGVAIHVHGDINIPTIAYKDIRVTNIRSCGIQAHIQYHTANKVWQMLSSKLQHPACTLQVHGSWSKNPTKLFTNLKLHIQDADVQRLLAYVSSHAVTQYLHSYQPTGIVTCQLHWQQYQRTALKGDFTYKAGTILLPGLTEKLQIAHVKGSLSLPYGSNKHQGSVTVDEYMATLGDSEVRGACHIMDLEKPILQAHIGLHLKLDSLVNYFHPGKLTDVSGEILGTCDYQLPLQNMTADTIKDTLPALTGEFKAQGLQFHYNNTHFQLEDTTLLLQTDGSWLIPELVGKLDGKTFVCSGTLHHGHALFIGKQPSHFTAKLYADYLPLDQLLATQTTGKTQSANWWPQLAGVVICDIDEVVYKRFEGKKLRATLQVNAQQIHIDDLVCWFAGGKIALVAKLQQATEGITITTQARLQHIPLATLFYTCENFHQQFLVDHHLGGKVDAHITLSMKTDKHWHLDNSSLQGEMVIQLAKGLLKNFEPLKQLKKYVSDEELNELHFSALKNTIRIQDSTIHIPPMHVHTSITSIQLSGTHTFDGKIDYSLVVPLHQAKNKHISTPPASNDAKQLEGLNLYLKLQGDVKQYTLAYDGKLLQKALKESFKEQGTILGDLLRGKAKQQPEDKAIAIDEYFDFE